MADADVFVALRPDLLGVAYRMLGRATEAEDVVSEVYLRWSALDEAEVRSPRAYLTTMVVRRCLDQLTSARARRETYPGPWLPEPVCTDGPGPEESAELGDSLSLAFLVLLEELTPAERAVFLLREVFDYPYPETAAVVGRSEAACRQLAARARAKIGQRRQRFDADRRLGEELARRFVAACGGGDTAALLDLLAPDVVLWADGGGVVQAAPRPVVGADRAARFLVNVAKRIAPGSAVRVVRLNGQPGVVVESEAGPGAALVLDVAGGRIIGVRVVTNPEKLAPLAWGATAIR